MVERCQDPGASVAARLAEHALGSGDDSRRWLEQYCLERFLHRLGESGARERFILKGARLLRVWSDRAPRATRDLDLLRKGGIAHDAVREDFASIAAVAVPGDGVVFNASALALETIRVEDGSVALRATLPAQCASARLRLPIHVGPGDAVWPPARERTLPVLLGSLRPKILTYPPEAVIAEQLVAIVAFGDRVARIQEHFEMHHLAMQLEFDRVTLVEAVRRTFARHRTRVPQEEPIGLTPTFWDNPAHPAQLRAFARRAGVEAGRGFSSEILGVLRRFLLPILADLRTGIVGRGRWPKGGPWR